MRWLLVLLAFMVTPSLGLLVLLAVIAISRMSKWDWTYRGPCW